MKIQILTHESLEGVLSLKEQWLSGEIDDYTYTLSRSLTSSIIYLQLTNKKTGKVVNEEFTMSGPFGEWISAKIKEQEEEE